MWQHRLAQVENQFTAIMLIPQTKIQYKCMEDNFNFIHVAPSKCSRTLQIMKISLFLFFIGIFSAVAGNSYSQQAEISVSLSNVTIREAFRRIEKSSDYVFLVADAAEKYLDKRVTAEMSDETIGRILDVLLQNSELNYRVVERQVSVYPESPRRSPAQTPQQHRQPAPRRIIIRGFVGDAEGDPLPGATIKIQGTPRGTVTDVDGEFILPEVEINSVLEVSYVGMQSRVIPIGSNSVFRILLSEDESALQEVVVTGIFRKAKESYTGAVSTIDSEQLKVYRGQNLVQTLKNIDASFNVAPDNLVGSDPNSIPDITIRGNSSLPLNVQEFNDGVRYNTNMPLIIMDGFEISLTKLMDYNDEEIESINILKDASATAIYGSRGANGVIVITSKVPEEGRLKVNAEAGISLEIPDLTSYDLLDAAGKLELERMAGLYNYPSNANVDFDRQQRYYGRLKQVLSGANTDWLSKPLRTGVGQRYNLRLEGGSKEFRWSISGGYRNTEGAMKGSRRDAFNGGIMLLYSVNNLTFRNYTSAGITRGNDSKYGAFSVYARQQPYNMPYDAAGNIVRYFDGFYEGEQNVQNPLYDATLNTFSKSGYQDLTNSFSIEWKILQEFTMRGQFSISSTQNTLDRFFPAEHSMFNSLVYETDEGFFRRGLYRYRTGSGNNYDGNVTLSYSKTLNEKHSLYGGLNYAVEQNSSQYYDFAAEGFTNENMSFMANALQYYKDGKPGGQKSIIRRLGLTGNFNYTYDNRYFTDFSYRVDGSSNFGSNKKYAPFWSLGAGWNLHREKFLAESPVINTLRLRASYGQTGSMHVTASGASTTYRYITDNRYMTWLGATLPGLGNPDLTWQKTDQYNVGTEFLLYDGRVRGSFDLYSKTTSNLLSYMNLPYSAGYYSYLANVGEVQNNGFESSLNVRIIRNPQQDLTWSVGAQLVYNKNQISKLSDAVKAQNEEYLKQNVDVSYLFYEGRPQNAIYAVPSLGIDPSTGEEVFVGQDGNTTNTWRPSDKVFQGSAVPTYRGNANTMLQWKGLIMNVSFGFYWGGKMYNQTLVDKVEVPRSALQTQNVDARVLNERWSKPGDLVFFKGLSELATRASSRFVMDDNVFNIQSVSVEYKWSTPALLKAAKIQSVTFGVNMSDLFYFSSVKIERGTSYPFARNMQGSIKLLF